MQQSELQSIILRGLFDNRIDPRFGRGQHFFVPGVRALCPSDDQPSLKDVQEAMWTLISRGLAFIDMTALVIDDWRVTLTEMGSVAAQDEVIHPDDPTYLSRVYSDVPAMAPMVRRTSTRRFRAIGLGVILLRL
jgi:hypothetical protein